jgi:predicted protein tyrosine phosphatase
MTQVFEDFYVGSYSQALVAPSRLGVTHIISVCEEEVPFFADGSAAMVTLHLPMRDDGKSDLAEVLPQATEFVARARRERADARILVHCREGVNRSVTVVIALLLATTPLSLLEAAVLVKQRRPIACPSRLYLKQLAQYEYKSRRILTASIIDLQRIFVI